MGTSTFFLFKRSESVPVDDLLRAFNKICIEEKLFFDNDPLEYDNDGKLKYTRVWINDKPFKVSPSRQICFNMYDEPYEFQVVDFKWDDTKTEYFRAIISEDFYENEDLLLRICHALLKIYPTAKIWIEEDWFYTLEDLDKITKMPFSDDWCYRNPKEIIKE